MDSGQIHRKYVLSKAKRLVVKVGSAVLTCESGLDARAVNRLADQLASLHDRGLDIVLVSSGAVASGRKVLSAGADLTGLPARQAASAVGQSRLMREYDEAFGRYGKVTAQILLTRDDLKSRKRFLNARNTMRQLLDWRAIPIVNENDTVSVRELEFGDNDTLASLITNLVEADLFINLTSAEGVFDKNPDQNPDAKPLRVIENIGELDLDSVCDGKTAVGTGGMYSKLRAARRVAQLGAPTLIVSGRRPFVLDKVFEGEDLGTWVLPEPKTVSRRKFWLAYHSEPAGDVWVDQGAARALQEKGKSLLPAGIIRVEGRFQAGALVRIKDYMDSTIGVGLTNYSAADMKSIMGRKTDEIAEVLGAALYQEAIHRDNLLLDPAI